MGPISMTAVGWRNVNTPTERSVLNPMPSIHMLSLSFVGDESAGFSARRLGTHKEDSRMSGILGENERGTGPVAAVDDPAGVNHVPIKVNGTTIEVAKSVEVREILAKAIDAGAIEGSLDEYIIERVERVGEIGIDERITVTEHEEFVIVPAGSTPVA